jgi:hypothetical protein
MESSVVKLLLLIGALAVYTIDGYFKIETHKGNIARLQKVQQRILQELGWAGDWSRIPTEPREIRRQYDSFVAGEQLNRDQIDRVKSDRIRAWFWGLFAWGIVDGWLLQTLSDSEFDPFEFRKG